MERFVWSAGLKIPYTVSMSVYLKGLGSRVRRPYTHAYMHVWNQYKYTSANIRLHYSFHFKGRKWHENSKNYEKSRKKTTTEGSRPSPSGIRSWNDALVALYHTSTYIHTYGLYVTMPTDPRSFYGYAHVYESVSCTSTRNMNTFWHRS